ncbi:MAG: amino acid permease [Calditrichia bacterium]
MAKSTRHIGYSGATMIGVGAIVGGGILALAGVAFSITGPGAILAFALNGVIALLTVFSFSELSARFPESGGTYAFSKKVFSVQAAFFIGWIVWFASIVAALLYALGFASFFKVALIGIGDALGWQLALLHHARFESLLALLATGIYVLSLLRSTGGGGQFETIGKVVLFIGLILAGIWIWLTGDTAKGVARLSPFFPEGAAGLFQAMGYTFIALQGFDLIAAIGGEVKDPGKTIPRSMLTSLGIGMLIYLPFLFVIATVGVGDAESIQEISRDNPETVVAVAAQNYLGPTGYWIVILAAILSMLSALQANLFAASRVARAMAQDNTLPAAMGKLHPVRQTPVAAILLSALMVAVLLTLISDVAAAGAVSSLIFLISFALAHYTSILARLRSTDTAQFMIPLFPVLPVLGALSCLALAIFQGIMVPRAGIIGFAWLAAGGLLYLVSFARRASAADAAFEALDPELAQLRGKRPLVLVPIANPANAEAMVTVANALAPPRVGRVLLLSVLVDKGGWRAGEPHHRLIEAQQVLREALTASFAAGLKPEALTTISPEAWKEISRVAATHGCESLLLGAHSLSPDGPTGSHLEEIMSGVDCDVVVLRSRSGWHLSQAKRIIVGVGGRGGHDLLRARLLGSLCRTGHREITFLRVVPPSMTKGQEQRARKKLQQMANDEVPVRSTITVVRSENAIKEFVRLSEDCDLMILGLQRIGRRKKIFGSFALTIGQNTDCPLIMISRRG